MILFVLLAGPLDGVSSADWAIAGACLALAVATILFIFFIQPDASDLAPASVESSINCWSGATPSMTICATCGLNTGPENTRRRF